MRDLGLNSSTVNSYLYKTMGNNLTSFFTYKMVIISVISVLPSGVDGKDNDFMCVSY